MLYKFRIIWDHYFSQRSKLIDVENKVGEKGLQYYETYLQFNFITFFTIINNLFNHFKDIFGYSYPKEYAIEKYKR